MLNLCTTNKHDKVITKLRLFPNEIFITPNMYVNL